jgi:hypothetical protein
MDNCVVNNYTIYNGIMGIIYKYACEKTKAFKTNNEKAPDILSGALTWAFASRR